MTEKKVCSRCGEEKPLVDFVSDKRKKSGYGSWCRECHRAFMRAWHAANRESVSARHKTNYRKNKERYDETNRRWKERNKEKVLQYGRAYSRRHSDRISTKNRAYHQKHRDAINARHSVAYKAKPEVMQQRTLSWRIRNPGKWRENYLKWKRRNPARCAEHARRRRALIRQVAICDLTHVQWEAIKAAHGYRCVYCGKKPKRLTMDHVVPLVKGGDHTAHNVVPACKSCNSRKGTRAPAPFQQRLFELA